MSVFGTPSIQAAAGINQAERAHAREVERKRPVAERRPRDGDRLDLEVQTAEADDAVRGATGNGREETTEDRQKQDGYRPQVRGKEGEKPRLDLSA